MRGECSRIVVVPVTGGRIKQSATTGGGWYVGGSVNLSSFRYAKSDHWLYLGKDVPQRQRVGGVIGFDKKWPLEDRLHRVASTLRQPFLDFIGRAGKEQRDIIAWRSSAIAWKSWGASDLFLLVCYLKVGIDVIREAEERQLSLVLIVEDPWLFEQLKDTFRAQSGVQFLRGGGLWQHKVEAIVFGIARRFWWLLRMLWYGMRQSFFSGRGGSLPQKPTVALYSYPALSNACKNGGWSDPVLPDLDRLLQNIGYEVIRFSDPQCWGLERQLGERVSYFRPLILYSTVSSIIASLFSLLWSKNAIPNYVADVDVRWLIEREWWLEAGRSAVCRYKIFYRCLNEMLRRESWDWIIFPYENQPWEKLLVQCAREAGIRTAGVQHVPLSVYSLSFFLGQGESSHMPIPDVLFTSGAYAQKAFEDGGIPHERLIMCGSIRHAHLAAQSSEGLTVRLNSAPLTEILVGLPLDIYTTRHLLAAIAAAFPQGGKQENIRFHVKAHPRRPLDIHRLGFPVVAAPASFEDALQHCGLVIFGGSTVGPEAVAWGRMALRYRPELLLNLDQSEAYGDLIPSCTDGNLRKVVLELLGSQSNSPRVEHVKEATSQIFAPFNRAVVTEIFRVQGGGTPVG